MPDTRKLEETIMAESPMTEQLQLMLNEEKWTRTLIASYTKAELESLDRFIEEAEMQNLSEDFRKICVDHLEHSRNSVKALYILGMFSMRQQPADESYLLQLMDQFQEAKKFTIVEHICNRILDHGENRIALARLAECYTEEGKLDQRFEIWLRLVRMDPEEADLAKLIAEKYEEDGEIESAIEYYKKALLRFINKGLFSNVKEVWNRLIELAPDEIDFFFHAQKKIAKQISPEKASLLLMSLYEFYKKGGKWTTALDILKTIIEYDERLPQLRKELLDCYTALYGGHSMFDECVRLSNINQSYRSLHEAMEDFEKRIAFDKGNFVFHRAWSIGRIANISNDEIIIDFVKSRGHRMSLKMAFDSLQTLSREHIWVLKAIWPKEKLRDKVKSDPAWALKTIIKSFDNKADMKRIKAELVPAVLSASEWNTWSAKAKEVLKTDPMFGNAEDDIGTFIVRDRPLSFEEKIYAQFKAEKNFFSRVHFFREYIEIKGLDDLDNDYFNDMLTYFSSFLKQGQAVSEFVIGSYLLFKDLASQYPKFQEFLTMSFSELFTQIENPVEVFLGLKDTELKNRFIREIKLLPQWTTIYLMLLPHARLKSMIEDLKSAGEVDKIKQLAIFIVENYKDMREAFIWLAKDLREEEWFRELGILQEKIILTLLHILDISFKEIENHKDTTENRKINRLVQNILFKEKWLETFLESCEPNVAERVYSMLADIKDLDPAIRIDIRKKLSERLPSLKFYDVDEKLTVSRGLMVTATKYQEKVQLLNHIMEVEVPANQREIDEARQLGDLRENAEYKAARERQDELNAKVGKLKNELERARIVDPESITTGKIGFGTVAKLLNLETQEMETYTIFGPWESDPDNRIISYLSPFGKHLMNHKVGDIISFTINERSFKFRVESIEKAPF